MLQGPIKALTYLLMHGILAASMGGLWAKKVGWLVSVPLGAFVRVAGQLVYFVLMSWVLNENLFALMVTNIYTAVVSLIETHQ